MEKELVQDRGWLTKEEMREAIAVSQSLPGPLAIQVGILPPISEGASGPHVLSSKRMVERGSLKMG
jgi:hypothetical protein